MGMTIEDYITRIAKYKVLQEKLYMDCSEHFKSREEKENIIRSQLNWDDFISLRYLIQNEIDRIKKLEVDDGNDN